MAPSAKTVKSLVGRRNAQNEPREEDVDDEEDDAPIAEEEYDEEEVSEDEVPEGDDMVDDALVNAEDLFDEVSGETCPRSGHISTF